VSVRGQTLTGTASSNRPAQRRSRKQPLPSQPLTEIAASINGIVAKLKAETEGAAQGTRDGEFSRLDAEVKELRKSINKRLAKSEEKQNVVLSILLRMES
jgi:hypothetical protein